MQIEVKGYIEVWKMNLFNTIDNIKSFTTSFIAIEFPNGCKKKYWFPNFTLRTFLPVHIVSMFFVKL